MQNQINSETDQNQFAPNFFSNKTASKMNQNNKETLDLNYRKGVVLKKEMTDSKFAVSDVSLGSQDSEYTESSMASLMQQTFQLHSKETTQSQRINNVQSVLRQGSYIVKPKVNQVKGPIKSIFKEP